MRAEMATAVDVDGIIAVHNDYISRIKDQCLLGPKVPPLTPNHSPSLANSAAQLTPILQTITTLLDLAMVLSALHPAHSSSSSGDQSMRDISVITAPRRRRRAPDSSSSSSEDTDSEEDNEDSDSETEQQHGEAHGRRLVAASARFNALLDFVKAGLRGVARAGVMPHLETLAEGLDGVGWEGRYG